MKTLTVETRDDHLYVTLNRPEVRNAFGGTLMRELREVMEAPDARAVVLAGTGKVFCAGADIDEMRRSMELSEEENRREAEVLAGLFRTIDRCPCPVIGRVHGAAMGGGLGLVSTCDMVVAAEDAKLAFSEVKLGIVPAVISPFVLRKIGVSAARRYFLTGEVFSAAEALRMGLVHVVVPEAELDASVEGLLDALRKAGPAAAREAKALIRSVSGLPQDEAVAQATAIIASIRTTPEGQEGLTAFLERRKPSWMVE